MTPRAALIVVVWLAATSSALAQAEAPSVAPESPAAAEPEEETATDAPPEESSPGEVVEVEDRGAAVPADGAADEAVLGELDDDAFLDDEAYLDEDVPLDEAPLRSGLGRDLADPRLDPPYSEPWLLRSMPMQNSVRVDQTLAGHDAFGPAATGAAASFAQVLALRLRMSDASMLVMRQGWAITSDPAPSPVNGSTFVLGIALGGHVGAGAHVTFELSVSVPEGGLGTDPPARNARLARQVLELELWEPNYFATVGALDVGWIRDGWTVQAEASLVVLARLYGVEEDAVVSMTLGAHVGYFVMRELSLALELHHQQYLSQPVLLADPSGWLGEHQSQTSLSAGLRGHARLGPGVTFRPGFAYGVGFDPPMAGDVMQTLQVDLLFTY